MTKVIKSLNIFLHKKTKRKKMKDRKTKDNQQKEQPVFLLNFLAAFLGKRMMLPETGTVYHLASSEELAKQKRMEKSKTSAGKKNKELYSRTQYK